MKNTKKTIIFVVCQLFFVLLGCGDVDGPCVDYIVFNIKSTDGLSIGSYSGEILRNGKHAVSFYCENDQTLSEIPYPARSCIRDNAFTMPAGDLLRDGTILSMDVIVYSFNKEMKFQAHFDLEFKYPQGDRLEGCETKTIEIILQ